jgi:hypothetical protein
MQWSDIQWNPSEKTLRQFAGLLLVIFGLLAIVEVQFRHRPQLALMYAAVAVTFGPLGLIRPQWLRPVWIAWSTVAFPIGWAVSTLILAMLFYLVFTPLAIAFRVSGRDALALRRKNVQTYWLPRPAARTKQQYFRQS